MQHLTATKSKMEYTYTSKRKLKENQDVDFLLCFRYKVKTKVSSIIEQVINVSRFEKPIFPKKKFLMNIFY